MKKTNESHLNAGLMALTVEDEQKEIIVVTNVEGRMAAAEARGHKIVFAFMQSDFQGGRIAYWHVTDPESKSYHSTLSMSGLRDWGVL